MELLLPTRPVRAGKADFDDLYNQHGPSGYFAGFAKLDYRIPAYTAQLVRHVITAARTTRPLVADVCCSYGINAALLNHQLTLADLYRHYAGQPSTAHPQAELDREYFAQHRSTDAVPVIGLDISRPALRYATRAGLIRHGIDTNLEVENLTRRDAELLEGTSVVCVSGGLGYVSARTMISILGAARRPPVIAGFVLRWIDIRPLIQFLTIYGYHIAMDDQRPYPQRRFANRADRASALSGLRNLRLTPSLIELRGYHAAVPFVAAPPGAGAWHTILSAASQLPPPVL